MEPVSNWAAMRRITAANLDWLTGRADTAYFGATLHFWK
jgi:hypothetical protein